MKRLSSTQFVSLLVRLSLCLGPVIAAPAQTRPVLSFTTLSNETLQVSWSAQPSQAQNVVSWNINVDSTIAGSNQIAGLVTAPYWNNSLQLDGNATGDPVIASNLVDNNGNTTTITVAQNSTQNSWDYWAVRFATPGQNADGTYNGRLLNGYQNKGASEAPYTSSVTISGIPYSAYDLYVYFSSDTGGRSGSVSDGNCTFYFSTLGPAAIAGTNALFMETSDTNAADNPPADYAVFPGLTGSTQTVNVTIPEWGGIAGFQAVQRPVGNTDTAPQLFVLQETSSLMPPVMWQTSPLVLNSNNGQYSVVAAMTNTARFFRLANVNIITPGFSGQYLTNGLVAFWKFNDGMGATAADASGNGYNLSLAGSPAWGLNYLDLNGFTQYGDAGSNFVTVLDGQDKTICAWINKTGSSQKGIVDKSFNTPGVGYGGWGFWVQPNQQLMWLVADSDPLYDAGAAAVVLGSWTFVSVVWHVSTQTADFYLNGVIDSSVGNSAAEFPSDTADLLVGNLRNNLSNGTYAFDGAMRDVGIYNRALSAAEIETNFLATELSTNVAVPDLLYYKMTEGAQSNPPVLLADSSTHGGTTGIAYAANVLQWQTNVGAIPATSIHFNGTATYIDTGTTNLFDFTTNLFTINLWVMPLTANGYLLDNETGQANGWYLNVGGAYSLNFGEENNGASAFVSTGAGAVRNGLFSMVTIVRTRPTNVQFYINGNPVATTGSFADPGSSANSLVVGVDRAGGHHLDGNIWLLQIWGTPLAPGDVANLYFNQVSGVPWP